MHITYAHIRRPIFKGMQTTSNFYKPRLHPGSQNRARRHIPQTNRGETLVTLVTHVFSRLTQHKCVPFACVKRKWARYCKYSNCVSTYYTTKQKKCAKNTTVCLRQIKSRPGENLCCSTAAARQQHNSRTTADQQKASSSSANLLHAPHRLPLPARTPRSTVSYDGDRQARTSRQARD